MRGREHWSHTARRPRFFGVDAIAAIPFITLLFYKSWWLFGGGLALLLTLYLVERHHQLTLPAACRGLRILLTGKRKGSLRLLEQLKR